MSKTSFLELDQGINVLLCFSKKRFAMATRKETKTLTLVAFIVLFESPSSENDFVPFGNKNMRSDFCSLSSRNVKTVVSQGKIEVCKD